MIVIGLCGKIRMFLNLNGSVPFILQMLFVFTGPINHWLHQTGLMLCKTSWLQVILPPSPSPTKILTAALEYRHILMNVNSITISPKGYWNNVFVCSRILSSPDILLLLMYFCDLTFCQRESTSQCYHDLQGLNSELAVPSNADCLQPFWVNS